MMGIELYLCGSAIYASREPTPRPSNVSMRKVRLQPAEAQGQRRTMEDDDDKQNFEVFVDGKREADQETKHQDERISDRPGRET